jgi:hypothetical protein
MLPNPHEPHDFKSNPLPLKHVGVPRQQARLKYLHQVEKS